ncbi:hypothetical protein LTR60_006175, partial [Cryomyces antarcticus]
MVFHKGLDAYGKPPEDIRNMYKKYQRMKPSDLYTDKTVVDFERGLTEGQKCHVEKTQSHNSEDRKTVRNTSHCREGFISCNDSFNIANAACITSYYEHSEMP